MSNPRIWQTVSTLGMRHAFAMTAKINYFEVRHHIFVHQGADSPDLGNMGIAVVLELSLEEQRIPSQDQILEFANNLISNEILQIMYIRDSEGTIWIKGWGAKGYELILGRIREESVRLGFTHGRNFRGASRAVPTILLEDGFPGAAFLGESSGKDSMKSIVSYDPFSGLHGFEFGIY